MLNAHIIFLLSVTVTGSTWKSIERHTQKHNGMSTHTGWVIEIDRKWNVWAYHLCVVCDLVCMCMHCASWKRYKNVVRFKPQKMKRSKLILNCFFFVFSCIRVGQRRSSIHLSSVHCIAIKDTTWIVLRIYSLIHFNYDISRLFMEQINSLATYQQFNINIYLLEMVKQLKYMMQMVSSFHHTHMPHIYQFMDLYRSCSCI